MNEIEEMIQKRIMVAKSEAVEEFIRRGRGLPMHGPAGAAPPKTRKRRTNGASKTPVCGKCGKSGHNARTCGKEAEKAA